MAHSVVMNLLKSLGKNCTKWQIKQFSSRFMGAQCVGRKSLWSC